MYDPLHRYKVTCKWNDLFMRWETMITCVGPQHMMMCVCALLCTVRMMNSAYLRCRLIGENLFGCIIYSVHFFFLSWELSLKLAQFTAKSVWRKIAKHQSLQHMFYDVNQSNFYHFVQGDSALQMKPSSWLTVLFWGNFLFLQENFNKKM